MSSDKRINETAAAERNREDILKVLKETIPLHKPLTALEIASGSGTHVGYFAEHLPNVTWRPSDYDPKNLPSLNAYMQKLPNILEPIVINISEPLRLESSNFDIMLCINMVHISPWAATLGLFSNAGRILQPQGKLFVSIFSSLQFQLRYPRYVWSLHVR